MMPTKPIAIDATAGAPMSSLLLPVLGGMPGSTTGLLYNIAVLCACRVKDGWVQAEAIRFSFFALGVAVVVDAAHRDLVAIGYACPFEVDAGPFLDDAAAAVCRCQVCAQISKPGDVR